MRNIHKINIVSANFLAFLSILLYLYISPSYSADIYQPIPFILIAISIGMIAFSVFSTLHNFRGIGGFCNISPVIISILVISHLPQLLGYITRYADPITYAGETKDIVVTHAIPGVINPAGSIFAANLAIISGLPATYSTELLGDLALILYLLCIVILLRRTRIPFSLGILFSALIVSPSILSITASAFTYLTLFPMFLYLVNGRRDKRHFILLSIIGSLMWIYHIIPAVFAIIIIIFQRIADLYDGKYKRELDTLDISLLVIAFTGFLWFSSTWLFRRSVFLSLTFLGLTELGRSQFLSVGTITQGMQQYNLEIGDILIIGAKRFGNWMVLMSLSFMGFIASIYEDLNGKITVPVAIISVSYIWSPVELLVGIIPSLNFIRMLRPGIILSPILAAAILIHTDGFRFRLRTSLKIILGLFVISGILIGYAGAYDSPGTAGANRYIMESDIKGMGWFFEYKDEETNVTTLWRSTDRYADLLMTPSEIRQNSDSIQYDMPTHRYRAPPHFGYPGYFGKEVGRTYYIEGQYDRAVYLSGFKESSLFIQNDFDNLSTDPTVNQLYSNGNVNISLVRPGVEDPHSR